MVSLWLSEQEKNRKKGLLPTGGKLDCQVTLVHRVKILQAMPANSESQNPTAEILVDLTPLHLPNFESVMTLCFETTCQLRVSGRTSREILPVDLNSDLWSIMMTNRGKSKFCLQEQYFYRFHRFLSLVDFNSPLFYNKLLSIPKLRTITHDCFL